MAKRKKALNGGKKKKNKENKRDNRRAGTAMEVVNEGSGKKNGPMNGKKNGKKKNAPLVFARPKGPKGTRQKTSVTEVKEDNMKRIQAIYRAHKTSISQVVCTNGVIYTCGQDGFLSTWVTKKEAGVASVERKSTKDAGGPVWSLLVKDDAIFCGLQSGSIKIFFVNTTASLEGHDKRVSSILEHQGVVISGSFDGTVKLWKMQNNAFSCVQSVTMPAEVRTLLLTTAENAVTLWVGTTVGLYGLNLHNLEQPPVKLVKDCNSVVSCLLEYANHVIVGFRDGSLKFFDKNGVVKHEMQGYPDCKCLFSFTVIEGSRLICTFNDGRLSSFALPQLERKARWDAFDHVGTTSVCSCGADGYYMIGSQAGDLHLWQFDDIDDAL